MSQGIDFDANLSGKIEALYSTPDVVAQRERVHQLLNLTSGERVLDIGSGPGLLANEMATTVGPSGRVCGVDLSEDMLAISQSRCVEQPWAEFQLADATKLPYEDKTFDAAVSTQVYEYVADIPAALSELHRTLRPGGRALVLDSDWHSIAIHTRNPMRMARVMSAWDEHFVHPCLPRTLTADLRGAGFSVDGCEIIPLLNTEYRDDTYSKPTLEIIASFVVGRQGVSAKEARAWHDEFAELSAQGRYFFCLNRYVFVAARKSAR